MIFDRGDKKTSENLIFFRTARKCTTYKFDHEYYYDIQAPTSPNQ